MVLPGHCEFLQTQDFSRSRADTVVSPASIHLQPERKREPKDHSHVQKALTVLADSWSARRGNPYCWLLSRERVVCLFHLKLVLSRVVTYILPGCRLHHPKATRHSSARSLSRNSSVGLSRWFSCLWSIVCYSGLAACCWRLMADSAWFKTRRQALVQVLHKSLTHVCVLS